MTRKTFWLAVAERIHALGGELQKRVWQAEHQLHRAEELSERICQLSARLECRVAPPAPRPPSPVEMAGLRNIVVDAATHYRVHALWKDFLEPVAPIQWKAVPDIFAAPPRDYSHARGGADGRPESRFMRDEYYVAAPLTIIDEGWSPWTPVQGTPLGDWLDKHMSRPT